MVVFFELAFRPLCLIAFCMEMGDQVIQPQQEQNADPESGKGREERQLSHPCSLFHRRNQQTPHRGRYHHTGGKAGQNALYGITEPLAHKEHTGRAQRCAEEGDQNAVNGLSHAVGCLSFTLVSFDIRSRSRGRRRPVCTAAQNSSRRPPRSWRSPNGTWRVSGHKAPAPASACRYRIS